MNSQFPPRFLTCTLDPQFSNHTDAAASTTGIPLLSGLPVPADIGLVSSWRKGERGSDKTLKSVADPEGGLIRPWSGFGIEYPLGRW